MQLKPSPNKTIRVIARDEETGKSRSTTVYDATPEEVIELVRRAAEDASTSQTGDGADTPEPHRESA